MTEGTHRWQRIKFKAQGVESRDRVPLTWALMSTTPARGLSPNCPRFRDKFTAWRLVKVSKPVLSSEHRLHGTKSPQLLTGTASEALPTPHVRSVPQGSLGPRWVGQALWAAQPSPPSPGTRHTHLRQPHSPGTSLLSQRKPPKHGREVPWHSAVARLCASAPCSLW